MANAIFVRFLIAGLLLVPGWVLMAHMSGGGGGSPPPGSRGAQVAELGANAALVHAAQVLGARHDAHGTFAGTDLSSVPGTRLMRADAATFCVEAGERTWLYHLEGSAQEDNSWNLGAVKGPCA